MTITINQKLINRLRQEGFYPDMLGSAYIAMKSLQTGELALLDMMDDSNRSKRMLLVYYDLIRKGLWEDNPEETTLYRFTIKGLALMDELLELETGYKKQPEVEIWFTRWMDMWPVGVTTMGKLVRSDQKICLTKMKKFVKDYPQYSPDLILFATAEYLSERHREDWKGVRSAVYFIDKRGEGSDLAAWCEKLGNKPQEEKQTTAYYNSGLV